LGSRARHGTASVPPLPVRVNGPTWPLVGRGWSLEAALRQGYPARDGRIISIGAA